VIEADVYQDAKIVHNFTGAVAPLTSVAVYHPGTDKDGIVFAGCWDKSIHSWSLRSREPLRRYTGHTDFVKCVLATTFLPKTAPVLISGSADGSIIVWAVEDGRKLHVLKGHTRGVLSLAIDQASETNEGSLVLFSADSTQEIRRWYISVSEAYQLADTPIIAHETSVNALCFEAGPEGDLWTASSDKTVKRLVRARNWEADTTLPHPDFVRDVKYFDESGHVVTACRDEHVRVWHATSEKLLCTFKGHFEEVTGLALGVGSPGTEAVRGKYVVSVSIDGTLRKWNVEDQDILAQAELEKKEAEGENLEIEDPAQQSHGANTKVMTAEEEAELAELMEDDD